MTNHQHIANRLFTQRFRWHAVDRRGRSGPPTCKFRDLPNPQTYTQVVVARGTKLIFVSGQEPEDVQGKLVGRGDLAVQAHQVFANLGRALAAAGALPKQVAKITIYVVNYKRDEHLPIIEEARVRLFGDHKPADVVVGIATLSPDYLIEVDAVAVVDG